MANFCMNCGSKIGKDDNFCTKCGTKILKDDNLCPKCGFKIRKEDNFCSKCGTKLYKKPEKPLLKVVHESVEKKKAQEKAEEQKKKAKAMKEKETTNRIIVKNVIGHGGHCDFSCRHCYEEFMSGAGGIVGDFDDEGYVEYYCRLGHPVSFGSYCEYYE
ncbi:MAG: zinc ribbon domain-containing protein [Methanobrevibacter sp.]|nr:zinc ribbon domain-containing protein [Methanobrevibacter sp.]